MNMKWPVKGIAHSKMKTLDLRLLICKSMFMEWMKTHAHIHTMSFKHPKWKNTGEKTPKENVRSMQPNRQFEEHHYIENVFLWKSECELATPTGSGTKNRNLCPSQQRNKKKKEFCFPFATSNLKTGAFSIQSWTALNFDRGRQVWFWEWCSA